MTKLKPYVYNLPDIEDEFDRDERIRLENEEFKFELNYQNRLKELLFKENREKIIKSYNNQVSGVYMITNVVEDKIYIGSSNDIYARWDVHELDLIAGKHHNKLLQDAYYEFGLENFTWQILWEAADHRSRNYIFKKEQEYINNFNPEYNIKRTVDLLKSDYNPKLAIKSKVAYIAKRKKEAKVENLAYKKKKAYSYAFNFARRAKLKSKPISDVIDKYYKADKFLTFNESTFILTYSCGCEVKVDIKAQSLILLLSDYFNIKIEIEKYGQINIIK